MIARAQIVNPDVAEMTLTLTMSVKQWKELADLLPEEWPGWPVASMVRQAISKTIGHVETVREVNP